MTNLSDKYKNNLPFESSPSLTTISDNYNALENDTIFVNTASSAINITLPASPNPGSKIKVLDISANSQNNNITVLGNGNNIGGASAYVINTPDSSVDLLYINSNKGWNIANEYISLNKPGIPTGVSAIDIGTNRAYNDGAATVTFIPATSGDTADTYTAISTPGSYTTTGSSSPLVVTGLQSGVSYTFKVYATNAAGSSSESDASSSITATTVPQAPTVNSSTYGFESTSVAFTANATGGSNITGYTVTSSPGGFTGTGSSSPISVTGLTAGTAYTFTVTATNANGNSSSSSASSAATPFTASGGTIVTSGGYRYHTFTGTSNFVLSGNTITSLESIVIAGGGGGGSRYGGGGGGAGGFKYQSSSLSAGTYTATIGGGAGGGVGFSKGGTGSNTTFTNITAYGGGGGGSIKEGSDAGWLRQPGDPGGSGGGAASAGGQYGVSGGTATPSGQGNNGGSSASAGNGNGNGAGGGGAGAVGQNSQNADDGANGGAGTSSYSTWANATSTGVSGAYAGGGAGGGRQGDVGTGGIGGGGNGNASNGTANTGGGGGGRAGADQTLPGGTGGSGLVIVRYAV